ncbi:DNA-3-methyladenine glycosylase 2 family protein [Pseudomonas mediterranea]|uniref:DNA-3-methyladenine glycosylase family protein n=1 Tax=Pseudomonas mediterranea TaxID=183795 RepID=UPI0013173687|nr:DNA-3-methyladenine glycosylase [Pseudomonas mediterranea]QHA83140.1 DNA-3-methyladenine glycosylase 2 family protein [Pseudomonas mediterranea]
MPVPYHDASVFLASLDEDWRRHVETTGPCLLQPRPARDPYEVLVRAIAYQQLHAKAGDAIFGRLLALFPTQPFPRPEQILATDFEQLRGCGFSASKIATIQGIAQAALDGVVPDYPTALAMDDEALIERLVTLRGVGRWTVEMLLIYSLERPDILPVDDFGVREGYRRLKGLERQPGRKQMIDIGLAWSPYRTVAAWYLWRVPVPARGTA